MRPGFYSFKAAQSPTPTFLFSFGLVLYEMATGLRAFGGDSPGKVLDAILNRAPIPALRLNPELPAELEHIIAKALEKDRDLRYQSASDICTDLKRLKRDTDSGRSAAVVAPPRRQAVETALICSQSVDELEATLTRERESKPARVEGEGAEVALPISLATWQRSDWFLLASGILGAAVFLLLFYRFHPASALVITIGAEQQKQIVADALKKLRWNVEVGKLRLGFDPRVYYRLGSFAGNRVVRDRVLRSEIMGSWSGNLRSPEGDAKSGGVDGHHETDLLGRPYRLELYTPGAGVPIQPGPAPNEASMARIEGIAQNAVSALFGKDLSATKAESRAFWNPPYQQWWAAFEWKLPQQPQGLVERIDATVDASRLVLLSREIRLESPARQASDWRSWVPPIRYFFVGLMMTSFTLLLFFARRIYREPRSPPNLRLATLIGLGGAVAISPVVVWPTEDAPREWPVFSAVVGEVLPFSLLTLLSYAVLNTVLYYLRRRFPVQAANYLQLLREHVFARTASLEMLRGVFAGAAHGGVWMALVSLGGV